MKSQKRKVPINLKKFDFDIVNYNILLLSLEYYIIHF